MSGTAPTPPPATHGAAPAEAPKSAVDRPAAPAAVPPPAFPRILALAAATRLPSTVDGGAFDFVLAPLDSTVGSRWEASTLPLPAALLRLRLDRFDLRDPLVERWPAFFAVHRERPDDAVLDPRRPSPAKGEARARVRRADLPAEVEGAIAAYLAELLAAGARGFVVDAPDPRAVPFYQRLFETLRSRSSRALFIAATPGLPRPDALALAGAGFDYCLSSFAWWDMKARWLLEEHATLAPACPLIAEITPAAAARASDPEQARALLTAAGFTARGVIVPAELVQRCPDAASVLAAAAGMRGEALPGQAMAGQAMRALSSVGSPVSVIARFDGADSRGAGAASVLLVNASGAAAPVPGELLAGLPFQSRGADAMAVLRPHEARVVRLLPGSPVAPRPTDGGTSAISAAAEPRIVIENLSPGVAGGAFAVKRVVGERVAVTADIYTDGHEKVSAQLLWRAESDEAWQAVPMVEEGNDVWSAAFALPCIGRHEYMVEAWDDRFGYYREGLVKKVVAGVAAPVDFLEGRGFLEAALKRANGGQAAVLREALAGLDDSEEDAECADILAAPALAEVMYALDPRHHRTAHVPQLVDAERLEARFSAWYELFPRSMTQDKARHGSLRDVIDHLPRVAAMGFDTLYFPPIHPIGTANRKGPNNTLTPGPGDPGSPYAIGSGDGGHDALHPELGSFEDFRALIAAAKAHGLEIALDFAIQCSPDHPWLRQHPGWFAWRPDGSMKYAENPPKKYQDIVNVDFYGPDAVPDLWLALRDVVLLWVSEGVKVFRVDNPHTKPLTFWEWMIREVRSEHPEVIFLSEAFTRPKVMYRLAKIGFSQSYTYFTWRTTKAEITEYFEELANEPPREFFRPHLFVNTPDINPVHLQTGGRAAHRVRAVLAATLSGLWGVYAGFELCDAAPLPGREEYLDSEKYEIRPRPARAPGDIVDDITLLNRLRRGHPALQTHLNTKFYQAVNEHILFYGKPAPDGGDIILVALNLDPHGAHASDIELPLWEFGLPDDGSVQVEDLVTGERFSWAGKVHHLYLTPDEPYRIWRMQPEPTTHG